MNLVPFPHHTGFRALLLAFGLYCSSGLAAQAPDKEQEPTQGEIRLAFEAKIERLNAAGKTVFGEQAGVMRFELQKLKRGQCKRRDYNDYLCAAEIILGYGDKPPKLMDVSLHLKKVKSVWQIP